MAVESIFIPRPALQRVLDDTVAASTGGQAQLVWVLGETGLGKTFFLKDYLERHREEWIASFVTCSAPIGNQSTTMLKPYQPLKDVFEDLLANQSDTRRRLNLIRNISLTVLACIPVVGELAYGIKEIRRDLSEYKTGEREVDFSKFVQEYFNTLNTMSADAPVVICIDDIQWVDSLTLVALRQLFESKIYSAAPVTIILSGRRDEIESSADVLEFFSDTSKKRYARELTIQPFDAGAIREYVETRFPESHVDADLLMWFEQKTGGNPLFLHSYIQHLLVEGILHPDGTVKGNLQSYRGLPAEIKIVTNWLMKALDESDLHLLLTASILGTEFSLHELTHLMQAPALEMIRRLRKIKTLFGVCEPAGYRLVDGKESTVYRFTQHVIQTALYNELTTEEKEQLHRAVAQYLNSIRMVSSDDPDVLNSLASSLMLHARLGRQPEIEYESILLKARNTPELLDDADVIERLGVLAPELGVSIQELELAYRRALQLAPLMTRLAKGDSRALPEDEEPGIQALSDVILRALASIEIDEHDEAVRILHDYITRQNRSHSRVHPIVHILLAISHMSQDEEDRAVKSLRLATAQTSHPTYAAVARIGMALFDEDDSSILNALRDAARYEGRHEGVLQRLVRYVLQRRYGSAEDLERLLYERGITLDPMREGKAVELLYPKTAERMRSKK